jgi:hypothetical protein
MYGKFIILYPLRFFMYVLRKSMLFASALLTLGMLSAIPAIMNPAHAQKTQSEDNPFVVVFTLAGVDNSTGNVASWVTVNNITRAAAFYNASQVDLLDTTKDGFVDTSLVLPNGTLGVGDEYTACTIILEDVYLTCSTGFNAPTNRAEFVEVIAPSSKVE